MSKELEADMEGAVALHGSLSKDVMRRMARSHLTGAAYFARESYPLEGNRELAMRMAVPHRAYVTGAIMLSVAALEAAINEFFLDAADELLGLALGLDSPVVARLTESWAKIERKHKNTLVKYKIALADCVVSGFSEHRTPYRSAQALPDLRNALVHFGPEWESRQKRHAALSCALQKEAFAEYPYAAADASFFPKRCLGHGCAEWAVSTTITFVNAFCKKASIKPLVVPLDDPRWATR